MKQIVEIISSEMAESLKSRIILCFLGSVHWQGVLILAR